MSPRIVEAMAVLAFVLLGHWTRGAAAQACPDLPDNPPTIIQESSANPPQQLWCITQPNPPARVFNIEIRHNPTPCPDSCGSTNQCEATSRFTILPATSSDVIGSLTIERPLPPGPPDCTDEEVANKMVVIVGNLNNPNLRFAAVYSTSVVNGGHGMVQVDFNYVGTVGAVSGVNTLFGYAVGDVAGPIECHTHIVSGQQPPAGGYESFIDIRSNGDLRGDVAILPVPDESLPARGIIQRLEFPLGTIGRDDNNDGTLDGPVNILADEIVESVYANEAWANIRGTGTLVRPNNDTFVERLGYIDTSDYATAAGGITAAFIQMGYESIESFSDALAHMTPEQQTAEMRTLGGLLPGGQE